MRRFFSKIIIRLTHAQETQELAAYEELLFSITYLFSRNAKKSESKRAGGQLLETLLFILFILYCVKF
jgi:hypothetical protein